MKRNFTVLLTILICSVTACQSGQKKDRNMDQETKLKIETTAGDIIVKLYNETPQHRDNFIKLAEEDPTFKTYTDNETYIVPPCHQGFYDTGRRP